MSKIKKITSPDDVLEYLVANGFPEAAVVDETTVRIESFKFCDVLLKRYANKSNWHYLIYGRAKQTGVREWAMDVARKVGEGTFAGMSVLPGRPDKAGDGARVVVAFNSAVDSKHTDDAVSEALLNKYARLRESLLQKKILEAKPKREPLIEYVPTVQEIRRVLEGLLKTFSAKAWKISVFDIKAECRRYYSENKKVLDFIFNYGKMGLKADVDEALLAMAAQGLIDHKSEDGELDFTMPALDKYLCKGGERAYRCFVDGVWAGSEQVCVVMALRLAGDESLDDQTMKFRKRFVGEEWEKNKSGSLKPIMNLPWCGKNGKAGKKNWKPFSLLQDGEPLSSAVEAAVREFVEKGVPKILECLR